MTHKLPVSSRWEVTPPFDEIKPHGVDENRFKTDASRGRRVETMGRRQRLVT